MHNDIYGNNGSNVRGGNRHGGDDQHAQRPQQTGRGFGGTTGGSESESRFGGGGGDEGRFGSRGYDQQHQGRGMGGGGGMHEQMRGGHEHESGYGGRSGQGREHESYGRGGQDQERGQKTSQSAHGVNSAAPSLLFRLDEPFERGCLPEMIELRCEMNDHPPFRHLSSNRWD